MTFSSKRQLVPDAVFLVIGTLIFSFFIGAEFPLRIVAVLGLVMAGWSISEKLSTVSAIYKVFFIGIKRSKFVYLLIGLLLGIFIGLFYRWHLSIQPAPEFLTRFAFIAALIGLSEELIFRGYLQGVLAKINVWMAILVSSLAHTLYKATLFLSPFALHKIDVGFLFIWTFSVGCIFGWLTKASKSVIPALMAHALFDIWVYGQLNHAPWWVW